MIRTALALLPLAMLATAQTQAPTSTNPTFEVASVRPTPPDGGRGPNGWKIVPGPRYFPDAGRVTAVNSSLWVLLLRAYHLQEHQLLGGPDWWKSDFYNIEAKAAGPSSNEDLEKMLQTLLIERFRLKFHRETRDLPVYTLTVLPGGAKLQPVKDGSGGMQASVGRGHMTARNGTTGTLALTLTRLIGVPVIDQTGLTDHYDFALEYDAKQLPGGIYGGGRGVVPARNADAGGVAGVDAPAASDPGGPSIFTAVQKQLGLKLDAKKMPTEVFVIESAQHPSEN